jgi:predicted DNA-binding transcriptional regulator AlpA
MSTPKASGSQAPPDRLIDINELSHRLAISKKAIYNDLYKGKFPLKPIRANRKLRWKQSDVNAYILGLK